MADVEPEDITPEMVEAVEAAVGMGSGAWDCVDPKEIIAAALNLSSPNTQVTGAAQPRSV